MIETVAWVSLGIGIVIALVFIMVGFTFLRNRKKVREEREDTGNLLNQIDEASDAALNEINKTSRIVLDEIEEKYQAMLFLYNLLEEKKKEIVSITESVKAPPVRQKPMYEPVSKPARTGSSNAKHDKIRELYSNGLEIPEIAKKMNVGQGEVKLILDLAKR